MNNFLLSILVLVSCSSFLETSSERWNPKTDPKEIKWNKCTQDTCNPEKCPDPKCDFEEICGSCDRHQCKETGHIDYHNQCEIECYGAKKIRDGSCWDAPPQTPEPRPRMAKKKAQA